jgi:hypothetical protein
MSKLILFSSLIFTFIITSCGPAAEEKAKMIVSAKRTADSIANVINASMSSATEGIVPPPPPPATNTPTAAPTPTAGKKP